METGIADASMDIAKCLPLTGGTLTGNLAFSKVGTGGGLNANIHNLALHSTTGNGQMLTAATDRIYVGNPNTNLTIESKQILLSIFRELLIAYIILETNQQQQILVLWV